MVIDFFKSKLLTDNSVMVSYRLLSLFKINTPISYIKSTILEHENHGSLLAIYDFFESLGLNVEAFQIDKKGLLNIKMPFITQLNDDTFPTFVVVKNITNENVTIYDAHNKKRIISIEDFEEIWTGVCLEIKSKEIDVSEKIKNNYSKERFRNYLLIIAIIIFIYLLFSFPLSHLKYSSNTLFIGLYIMLKFAGLSLGFILLWHELDRFNPIIKSLCSSSSEKVNCNAVLNSNASNLFGKYLNWSEVGLAYFFSTLFILLFCYNSNSAINMITLLSLLSIPFILFSFFYQAFVLKQYCILCVITQLILVGEVILVFLLKDVVLEFELRYLLFVFLLALIPLIVWKSVKPLMIENKGHTIESRKYNKLKNDLTVFNSLLSKSQKIKTNPKEIGIYFPNEKAIVEVVKVCNPFCGPCAKAHPILDKLLHENLISLRIIFFSRAEIDKLVFMPTFHLMAINESDKYDISKALDFWYYSNQKKYELLAQEFPLSKKDLEKQQTNLEQMYSWCKDEQITHTPTVFINGRKLPKQYNMSDLSRLIR